MPANNPDLHGMAPDKCSVALLLLDVINDLEFPGAEQLLEHALPMAERIEALKVRAGKRPGGRWEPGTNLKFPLRQRQ